MRAIGVAESFVKGIPLSTLVGVVMRGDFYIDGISVGSATVGGMDATDGVIKLFKGLDREDVNFILLNGSVISWFNIIDLKYLADRLKIPVISITYEESDGLEDNIIGLFDDWEDRLKLYRQLGDRKRVMLSTGYDVFVRSHGLNDNGERLLLDRFTIHGKVPEPLRVAKLIARAVLRSDKAHHRKVYQSF
ncbi:MAG: DUF99 family protein [Halobacteriota archaeon]|nr:DUF99 family protein [Halobacteriota archaeon]